MGKPTAADLKCSACGAGPWLMDIKWSFFDARHTAEELQLSISDGPLASADLKRPSYGTGPSLVDIKCKVADLRW